MGVCACVVPEDVKVRAIQERQDEIEKLKKMIHEREVQLEIERLKESINEKTKKQVHEKVRQAACQ